MSVGAILADITKPRAGRHITRIEFVYDDDNRNIEIKYYEYKEHLFTITNTYDEKGNVVSMEKS